MTPIEAYQGFYAKVEKALLPLQPIVFIGAIVIIFVTIWSMVQKSAAWRTAWIVYLFMP